MATTGRTQRSISDPHLHAGRIPLCEGSNLPPASQMRHHRRSVDRVWPPALEMRIARLSIDQGSSSAEPRAHIIPVPPPVNYNRFSCHGVIHSEPLSSCAVIESDEEEDGEEDAEDANDDTLQAPLTSLPRPLKPRMASMLPPHLRRMSSLRDPELVGGFYHLDEQQQQNYQQGRYPHIHVEYGGQHLPRRLSKVYKESSECSDTHDPAVSLPTIRLEQQQQQQQQQNAVMEQSQGGEDHFSKPLQQNISSPHVLRPIPTRLQSTPVLSKTKDMSEFGEDLFLQSTFESYDREGNTTFRRPSLARQRSPGANYRTRLDSSLHGGLSQSHLSMEAALPRTMVGEGMKMDPKVQLHAYTAPTRPINMAWPSTLASIARPPSRRKGPLSPSSSRASSPRAHSNSGSPTSFTRVPLSESSFQLQSNRLYGSRPNSRLGSRPSSRLDSKPNSRPNSRLSRPNSPLTEKSFLHPSQQENKHDGMEDTEMDMAGSVPLGSEMRVKSPSSKAYPHPTLHHHHPTRLFEPIPTTMSTTTIAPTLLISDPWWSHDSDRWKSPTLSALASESSSRGTSPPMRALSPLLWKNAPPRTGRHHSRHFQALPIDPEMRTEIPSIEAHDEVSLQDIWRMEDEERRDRLNGVAVESEVGGEREAEEGQSWFRSIEDHITQMKGEAHAHAEARLIQQALHSSHA